ncbi:MAG: fused MFS/spermidine synthase [Thermoleophilia bacterium]|nr:fused MFS/spermidine synthase [Thermoleophilia bacterium]
MSPERRSAVAISVAVFLAGAALLGLEIAASRVLAPYFGNSLYVWGALIGIVLAGLSTGYWVGGVVADRYPTPRLLVGILAAASVLVLAIPFVDGWVLDRLVEWDPGPRLNPLLATIFLFGAQSVILGTASPIAVRLLGRSVDRLGRTAGRLFAVSTAGSIAGTFATSFWLIPELGTDQVLASAAVGLMLAAAAVALVERLAVAGLLTLVLAGASVGAVVSLAPESGRTVAASQLRNWSPVYRQQRDEERLGSIEETQTGYTILHRGLAVPPDRRRRGRRQPLSPLRQLLPERDVQGRPVPDALRVRRLPAAAARLPALDPADPLRRPRRRLRAEADVARLPGDAARRRGARPGRRRRRLSLLRGAARPAAADRGRGRAALPRRERGAVGRDRDRRLLLRLDPVPPRDARVPRAGALAAHAGRRRRDEHHRRRARQQLAAVPLDAAHVPGRLPDRRDPPGPWAGRP